MADVFLQKPRHVVPSFRRFVDTAELGELNSTAVGKAPPLSMDFQSAVDAWHIERSVGLAGDLVGAGLVTGHSDLTEVLDAAGFLLEHTETSSESQRSLARKILFGKGQHKTTLLPQLKTFLEENN